MSSCYAADGALRPDPATPLKPDHVPVEWWEQVFTRFLIYCLFVSKQM